MTILKCSKNTKEQSRNSFPASFGIPDSFLMNQRTISEATLHNSYKNSTSPGFIVELSISFVTAKVSGIWLFDRSEKMKYFDDEIR